MCKSYQFLALQILVLFGWWGRWCCWSLLKLDGCQLREKDEGLVVVRRAGPEGLATVYKRAGKKMENNGGFEVFWYFSFFNMVFSFEKKWLFNSYFKYNDNFVNKCIFLFIFYPMMLTVFFYIYFRLQKFSCKVKNNAQLFFCYYIIK
jgi:hypothetical protein